MRKKRALEHSLLRGQDWGGEGSREGDWGSTQWCRRKPRKRDGQLNQCFVTSVRLEMATEFRNMEIFGDPDESTFSGWVRGRLSGGGSTKKCKAKECTSWVRPTLVRILSSLWISFSLSLFQLLPACSFWHIYQVSPSVILNSSLCLCLLSL